MKILILFLVLLMSTGCANLIHKSCTELLSKRVWGDFIKDTKECEVHGHCVEYLGDNE